MPCLALEHREAIDSVLRQLRQPHAETALSDLTFANLYLFRVAHDYRYLDGDLPCISGRAYDGTPHLIPLFDLAAVNPSSLTTLLLPGECFYPVSSETAMHLSESQFRIDNSRDDSDYLFLAADFAQYRSHPLRGQRAAVLKLRARCCIRSRDIRDDDSEAALRLLSQWCAEKGLAEEGADASPCREALRSPQGLPELAGQIYYLDEQPAGFLLTEPINPDVLVVRFAKGLAAFDGIYPLMFQELCRYHGPRVRWLNFECDLGKSNFRRSKLSYAPAQLLSKFRVRPAGR